MYENEQNSQSPYGYNQYSEPMTKKGIRAMKKVQKADAKAARKAAGKKRFFPKLLAGVGCAILLGGVAGGAWYGVNYAGHMLFPINDTGTNESGTVESVMSNISTQQIADKNVNINATVYDVSDIVSEVITSVVAIDGIYTDEVNYGFFGSQVYKSQVSGSGIIIGTNDDELLIVTNAHVVEDVDDLAVTFYDGSEASAVIKGMKSNYDLAVLAVKLSDIPKEAVYSSASLGESSEIKVGEAAIAVGNSMGYGISVTTGCISALDKTVTVDGTDYNNLIQTDAAINPGNSGGALFNAKGEVIGINSVKMSQTGVEGMGYAISISSVRSIIEELSLEETKVKLDEDERGYLGITGITITESISDTYGYPVGVAIRSISKGMAADKAGLIKNDIITAVDQNKVESIDELVSLLSYYPVGAEVEVEYYHMNASGEYEKHTVDVTLSEKSSD